MRTVTTSIRLYTDSNATGEVAEWQEKARQRLDSAEVKYREQYVTNDWRDGTFTPMIQTRTAVYAGLDLIEQYVASVEEQRKAGNSTSNLRRHTTPRRRF